MTKKNEEVKNRYKELEELENDADFNSLRKRTTFQYARYWYCDMFIHQRFDEIVRHVENWLQPLSLSERLDFYRGWEKNQTYCMTVNHEQRKNTKLYNKNAPPEIQKILDESAKFWKNQPKDFKVENKYIKRQLKHIQEQLKLESDQSAEQNNEVEINLEIEGLEDRVKIILLDQLGILRTLRENEVFKNNIELAKIVTQLITSKDDKRPFEKIYNSLRTDITYIGTPKNKTPKNKNPRTTRAVNKVNSVLAKYGLPIITE